MSDFDRQQIAANPALSAANTAAPAPAQARPPQTANSTAGQAQQPAAPTMSPSIPAQPTAETHPAGWGAVPQGASVDRGQAPDTTAAQARLDDPNANLSKEDRARLQAQVDLAGRFQVVGNDVPANQRLPNQVSRADFERMSNIYGDIRSGTGNIQFDNASMVEGGMNAAQVGAYKDGTMNDIADLMQTPSGRALMQGLAAGPNGHVTMLGQAMLNGQAEPGAARSAPHDASGAAMDPNLPVPAEAFNGTGMSSTVFHVPGQNAQAPGAEQGSWADFRSDVVLMHELTHSMHYGRGSLTPGAVTPGPDTAAADVGEQAWEQQAVGLGPEGASRVNENRYREQRAQLANGGAAVTREGDANMPRRPQYVVPPPISGPPPQPAPATAPP